jgi:purine-binding chemotaxis protein CheW
MNVLTKEAFIVFMQNQPKEIFCFTIDHQRFAIPLTTVDQVLMAMAVSPVPNLPALFHGLIDYHGLLVPVINLRSRLKMPLEPVRISDVFILASTPKRKIALVADRADGVMLPCLKDWLSAADMVPGHETAGFLRCDDGMIVIYDLENFLSGEDEIEIQKAIDNLTNGNR